VFVLNYFKYDLSWSVAAKLADSAKSSCLYPTTNITTSQALVNHEMVVG